MRAVKQKRFKADGFCIKPMTPPLTLSFLFSCSMVLRDLGNVNGISLLLTLKSSLRYVVFFYIHYICKITSFSCEHNSVGHVQRSILQNRSSNSDAAAINSPLMLE